jgi:hypothetical protein
MLSLRIMQPVLRFLIYIYMHEVLSSRFIVSNVLYETDHKVPKMYVYVCIEHWIYWEI